MATVLVTEHIDVLLRTTTVRVFFLVMLTSCDTCRQILGTFIYVVAANALVFVCVREEMWLNNTI